MKCYGCFLKSFKWTCKKFSSVEEADVYALGKREEAYATKLVIMNDYIPKCFENVVLESRLSLPLILEK